MPRSKSKSPAKLPSKADLIEYIQESPTRVNKRDIARAFKVKGDDRPALKAMLRELEQDGVIERSGQRRFSEAGRLPEVAVLIGHRIDADGELIARPTAWDNPEPAPVLFVRSTKVAGRAIGIGDRVLARLSSAGDGTYEAHPIRKLGGGARQMLGILERTDQKRFILCPTDRRDRHTVQIDGKDAADAKHGELVLAEVEGSGRRGTAKGRVIERLHQSGIEKALSLIAIHNHGIPHEWAPPVVEEAKQCKPAKLGQRDDLRPLPLVTIDGEDARDFDDAVWCEPDQDLKNKNGWHIIVAIADVSWYVRPGSHLDQAAYERGNSTYFPDRVVPMLPEALSNEWCSLKPDENRPCVAVHMWIDKTGKLTRHRFVRGLMRSVARLTYEQVQQAYDGDADKITKPLLKPVIQPLYRAFNCLDQARRKRGALALDLPERKIVVDKSGQMTGVVPRARMASHQLIEEFMILANVAAAQTLQKRNAPGLYRVHEPPEQQRVADLTTTLKSMGLTLAPSGSLQAKNFNKILDSVKGEAAEGLVHTMILRTQSQARYEPENLGHFGLALNQYTHFTSPIRRYSDLIVHRALISELKLGPGGFDEHKSKHLSDVAEHVSMTERRSVGAERETVDRFTAAFLTDRAGAEFNGHINGVSRFGIFVTLSETGADGILPIRRLPRDHYDVFEHQHTLEGRSTGTILSVGDPISVRLIEADALTGSLVFDYIEHAPLRVKKTAGGARRPGKRKTGAKRSQKRRGKKRK